MQVELEKEQDITALERLCERIAYRNGELRNLKERLFNVTNKLSGYEFEPIPVQDPEKIEAPNTIKTLNLLLDEQTNLINRLLELSYHLNTLI